MLRDWLEKRGIRHNAFAGTLGLSAGYLSDLMSGVKKPSLALALRIDHETGGAVGPHSWYSAADLAERYVGKSRPEISALEHDADHERAPSAAQGNEVAP